MNLRHKITKLLPVFLLLIFCLITALGGTPAFSEAPAKVIRVAGDINYPPYEFMDQNGVYRGFNVDMLNVVFLEMEVEFELIPMNWEDALQALRRGEVDMVQGMMRTPEREGLYLFAEPLVTNSQAIFVRQDNAIISELADLTGKKVTYQEGDAAEAILDRQLVTQAVGFADQERALLDVLGGHADAFVGNRLTAIYYLQKLGRLDDMKIVGEPMAVTDYGMAVNVDHPELLKQINSAIKDLKSEGIYERIYKKWFGEQLSDYGMTLDQIKTVLYVLLIFLAAAIMAALVVRQWNEKLSREVEIQTEKIREQEVAIRQYDKMKTVGSLAAGIAHELRNPLTSIKALSELVPLKRDNAKFIEEFNEIVPAEIARMDQLISDLLDYARPKASEPKPVELANLIENLKLLVRPKCESTQTTIGHRLEAPVVCADPNQLKQILLNLILNSLEAMETMAKSEGWPGRIEITSRNDAGWTVLELADNGPGMAEEDVAQVFEPFVSTKRGGHGLGLPIVEQLVRENQGTIQISSQPGQGTRIMLRLPSGTERGECR